MIGSRTRAESGEFEAEWSLDFLRRLLGAGGLVAPNHKAADRLGELSDSYPLACVETLQLLVEAGVHPWFVLGSEGGDREDPHDGSFD